MVLCYCYGAKNISDYLYIYIMHVYRCGNRDNWIRDLFMAESFNAVPVKVKMIIILFILHLIYHTYLQYAKKNNILK